MSHDVSLAMSASIAAVVPPLAGLSAPAHPPQNPEHINVNAPSYISPSITFDPVTSIVVFTFRNS